MAEYIRRDPSTMAPSRSLIGWGAVFAGAFTAFVTLSVLSTLGIAIGLTGDNALGTGAAIWSVIVAVVALFFGGWVMSHSEVISSRGEAAIHGVVLWGVLFLGLLMLAVSGVQLGISAITGALGTVMSQVDASNLTQIAREAGITDTQLQQIQQRLSQVSVPAAQSAWWTLVGMIVSLGSVMWGSALGVPSEKSVRHTEVRV